MDPTQKQLLCDDALVADKRGFESMLNPALRAETPALQPEMPWEQASVSWPSVVCNEGGEHQMWYRADSGAGAEDCGGGLYFRSADLFNLCYRRRRVARPQGGGFAELAIGEVDDVNAAADVDEAGDGAAGARAEVGGVGAEDEDASVAANEFAHGLLRSDIRWI